MYRSIDIRFEGNRFVIDIDHYHEATSQEENQCPPYNMYRGEMTPY